MTDRDFFAAAALAGILAHDDDGGERTEDDWAEVAYNFADAMLRERGNSQEKPDSSTPDADSRVWETQGHPQSTLTDAEREAVERAASFADDAAGYCKNPANADAARKQAATLRVLLERLK